MTINPVCIHNKPIFSFKATYSNSGGNNSTGVNKKNQEITVEDVLLDIEKKGEFKTELPSKFDIFLSHATIDQAILTSARNFLEAHGKKVFVAEDYYNKNGKSEDNINRLRKAMDISDAFYYLLSPHETVSGFMPWEIGYFDGTHGAKRKIRLLSMDENINLEETIGRHEFLKLYKDKEPLLISCFPGTGRSYLQNFTDLKVLNLDSPDFSWEKKDDNTFVLDKNGKRIRSSEFPNNYIKSIKDALTSGYDIILVSSHDSVRNALNMENITHVLVHPALNMKAEITKRCKNSASLRSSLETISKNWNPFIKSMKQDECPNKFELRPGEYLKDIQKHISRMKACGMVL